MWFYLKLAWRNILRNKRRTFIAGTAIGIGLAALILTDALMIGMNDHLVHSGTASFLGEAQVHRVGFRETLEIEKTIAALDKVTETLDDSPVVEAYAPRVMAFAMINSSANNEGVTMIGIDPARERHLSQIDDVMARGEYLSEDVSAETREIVIGSKLAEVLEVDLGDRVVLTTAQAHTGDLAQELFRVSGIYHFNIREMDRSMAFIPIAKSQQMLKLDGQVHEIAIKFTDTSYALDTSLPLWSAIASNGNEARGWPELLPQLRSAMELTDFSLAIVGIILFAVVSFGIINTLFMSLYERMFEFGVLRAIGTRPRSVFQLVLSEAGALSVFSIGLGLVISVIVLTIFEHVGIDYTGIEYAGVTFREKIYPVFHVIQFIKYPFWVFVLTTAVGVFPALSAARLTPARAMRKSM
jgi:ABC-type lipoprotein release transport system permease subunit